MNNIKNWLSKKGYDFKINNYNREGNTVPGIMVNNDYIGLYPSKASIENLNVIRQYVTRFHKNYEVQQRGNYTGILIIEK